MGLWANLFRYANRSESALLTPGKSYSVATTADNDDDESSSNSRPTFPNLGSTLLVSDNVPIDLIDDIIIGSKNDNDETKSNDEHPKTANNNKPSIVLIYSNC